MAEAQEKIISVHKVNKSFKLPHERTTTLKQSLTHIFRTKKSYAVQQVLEDITFDIKKGEFFGIVGRNGSGKSTLLKLLAGIYSPDNGNINVNGTLTPFIELGVGFNPELTGRENVFLNGALLGFNRAEMTEMYDDIVDFAELEIFMDQKLKNYSSGMQVRLAFSIAIRAKSDILLIDEVLAVGDEAFQQKCLTVFKEYKKQNKTIILVSHDMNTIKQFCDRVLLIDKSKFVALGLPHSIAKRYSDLNTVRADDINEAAQTSEPLRCIIEKPQYLSGKSLQANISWDSDIFTTAKHVGVAIYKETGEYVFGTNTKVEKIDIGKSSEITYRIRLGLIPGRYYLKIGLFGEETSNVLGFIEESQSFDIVQQQDTGFEGIVPLEHSWEIR